MKKRHQFLLVIGMLGLCVPVVRGQNMTVDLPQLTQYNPISPIAAQYMRYGEIPVGLSTGVPDISIPIYTIDANGLQIPISISYHASGIKVKDVSGPVGLGWVLNAGGMIVQQIKGKQDDHPSGSTSFLYPNADTLYHRVYRDWDEMRNSTDITWSLNQFMYPGLLQENDFLSDRYTYNFNGHTGTFYWDISGDTPRIVTIPYSPLKIVPAVRDGKLCFEITDTEGIVWTFSRYGSTTSILYNTNTVSWEYLLTSITFPDIDDKVLFTYKLGEGYRIQEITENIVIGDYRDTNGINIWDSNSDQESDKARYRRFNNPVTVVNIPHYLDHITWKDLLVDFHYGSDAASSPRDAMIETRLDSITVTQAASGNVIRAQFYNNSYLGNDWENYRRLLDTVVVNNDLYRFEYNKNHSLPNYTHAHDHQAGGLNGKFIHYEDFWGYYTGRATNHVVPIDLGQEYDGLNLLNPNLLPTSGDYVADREPDPEYTQTGILTTIHYPTGGRTLFEYEQNRGVGIYNFTYPINPRQGSSVEYFGGVRVKRIINYENEENDSDVEIRNYEYDNASFVPITTQNFYYYTTSIYWDFIRVTNNPLQQYVFFHWPNPIVYSGIGNRVFNSSTVNTYLEPGARSIMYGQVTEYMGNTSSVNGKTVYTFRKNDYYPPMSSFTNDYYRVPYHYDDEMLEYNLWSKYHNFDKGYIPHLLTQKKVFESKNGIELLRREEINNYSRVLQDSLNIVGVELKQRYNFVNSHNGSSGFRDSRGLLSQHDPHTNNSPDFVNAYYDGWRAYHIYGLPGYDELSSTTVREYPADGGEIVTTTSYGYDPARRILSPIETQTVNSNGDMIRQTVTHPFDHTGAVYNGMKNAHILSPVITQTTRNVTRNTDIQAIENVYADTTVGGKTRYLPDKLRMGVDADNLEDRITYHEYDQYGNPLHISKDSTTNVVYIWSYKGERLIAQIENATAGQIRTALNLGNNILRDISESPNPTDSTMNYITRIKNLRGSLGNDVLITTYTYDSRLRLTEVSDLRGSVTTYQYDDQNRLKQVALDGKIVETYKYHYSHQ